MPVKTVSVRSNYAVWVTNEIRALIKQRGKINKKVKRRYLKKDWDNFRAVRNDVILKLESVKLSFLTGLPKRYLILNVLVTKIGGN